MPPRTRIKPAMKAHSGRVLLRLPPALYGVLSAAAADAGLSFNEYCVRRLAAGHASSGPEGLVSALVRRASDIVGGALLGVIVHGSWARGQAMPTSDIDVLCVIQPTVALTRDLYRRWDVAPVYWDGRLVDPHFVHPPAAPASGGLWPEVALDGIVVFERDWQLSVTLADIRRDIAAGRLVRRTVHGQPYWTKAA